MIHKAIDTVSDFKKASDLTGREKEIVKFIENESGLKTNGVIWQSTYYGSKKLGAIHYRGIYNNKPAVLKIQGAKPNISEARMIEEFEKQNKSKIVRPPIIYKYFPWDDKKLFEAFILEDVGGDKVIKQGKKTNKEAVKTFFEIYREYRNKCLNKPWIEKPEKTDSVRELLEKGRQIGEKIKPEQPFRELGDKELINKGIEVLEKAWKGVGLEFVHGHLSVNDLIRMGNEVVVFSNLFWRWKQPFYDAVFGYHWFIYSLEQIEGITPVEVEAQREIWLNEIYNLEGEKKLITAALLERALAGLVMDSYITIDHKKPIAAHMVKATREEAVRLIRELA